MKHSNLTIIIPFVNEKYELYATLESIKQYSPKIVDVILIMMLPMMDLTMNT